MQTRTEAGGLSSKLPRLHFSEVLSVVKMLEILLPTPVKLAKIASATPAMTNPYSIAVAADRSAKKRESKSFKTIPRGNDRTVAPAFGNEP